VEFHFKIMFPQFLSVLGIQARQDAGGGQREDQIAGTGRADEFYQRLSKFAGRGLYGTPF
jgi:hypothetical protein